MSRNTIGHILIALGLLGLCAIVVIAGGWKALLALFIAAVISGLVVLGVNLLD